MLKKSKNSLEKLDKGIEQLEITNQNTEKVAQLELAANKIMNL
jgi:hypothetical protein